jgi:UDP-glucose 4-epimerase
MSIVWITGARGFIGRHLAARLSTRGKVVYGIGHGSWPDSEASTWGVSGWVNGEIGPANLELLRRISGVPRVIYHLAGGSSVGFSIAAPLEDFGRTVAGGARLLDWIRSAAIETRTVVVSSAAVYGSGHEGPIAEEADLRPFSPYGHHKVMLEQLCRSYSEVYGLRCTILRLFSAYGPELRKQLLWDLCSRLAAGVRTLELGGTGKELRDWIEISDIVKLLEELGNLSMEELQVFNGGSGIGVSVEDVARQVANVWDAAVSLNFSGKSRPGDPFSLVADNSRFSSISFKLQVPLSEGITKYVEWFRKHF